MMPVSMFSWAAMAMGEPSQEHSERTVGFLHSECNMLLFLQFPMMRLQMKLQLDKYIIGQLLKIGVSTSPKRAGKETLKKF